VEQISLKRQEVSELHDLCEKFSEIVLKKIIECPLVEGVREFLEKKKKKNIPVFLLSASPHEELLMILKMKDLNEYFKEVYGSPWTKEKSGQKILKDYELDPKEVIFIGDSVSDLKASTALRTMFLGRVESKTRHLFRGYPIIQNFLEIL
jgi:HAD superfamily hydrolase (TIGR01549 family)